MEKEKILIVEDDLKWTENYQRWLDDETLSFDAAETAAGALELLKTNYYAIVLLDLSLNPAYAFDRSSEDVQKYLKEKGEGTKHIIISNHANKQDIKLGAFTYKAFDTIFKENFEDINPFLESVQKAIIESKKDRPDFAKSSYDTFIGSGDRNFIEHKILVNFKPEGGLSGWFAFREKLFRKISPIYPHKTMSQVSINDHFIAGLFWSRQLGRAISIVIGNKALSNSKAEEIISSYLGWSHNDGEIIENKGLAAYFFIEHDLSSDDFIIQ